MTKVISLSNDAYSTMKALKRNDESFSDVVMRISGKKKKSIMDLAGVWSEEDAKKAKKIVAEGRKNFRTRNYVLS